MLQVSGRPIKFVGMGEKMEALEPFYPERMASRILGELFYLAFINAGCQFEGGLPLGRAGALSPPPHPPPHPLLSNPTPFTAVQPTHPRTLQAWATS